MARRFIWKNKDIVKACICWLASHHEREKQGIGGLLVKDPDIMESKWHKI